MPKSGLGDHRTTHTTTHPRSHPRIHTGHILARSLAHSSHHLDEKETYECTAASSDCVVHCICSLHLVRLWASTTTCCPPSTTSNTPSAVPARHKTVTLFCSPFPPLSPAPPLPPVTQQQCRIIYSCPAHRMALNAVQDVPAMNEYENKKKCTANESSPRTMKREERQPMTRNISKRKEDENKMKSNVKKTNIKKKKKKKNN